MRIILLVFSIIFFSCKNSPSKPSIEEANEVITKNNKVDSIWTTFPKRYYVGGDGVFVIKTEKDNKISKIQNEGSQLGVWNIYREEEGTGEFFLSTEKRNFYNKIQPNEGYEYLFRENPSNPDDYLILLAIEERGKIEKIVFQDGSPMGCSKPNVEKTILYDLFKPSNSTVWYSCFKFKKLEGKWTIDSRSSKTENEYKQLINK